MFKSTIPMLRVANARKSEALYEKLGFSTTWAYDPGEGYPVFLEVTRDQVSFHLSEHEGDGPFGVQLYLNVQDARKLYDEFVAKVVNIQETPRESEWGHWVFSIKDLDGNTLRFGSPQ